MTLPRRVIAYVAAVAGANAAYLTGAALQGAWRDVSWNVLVVLTVLGALGETLRVLNPSRGQAISFGFIVHLAGIPLLGVWGAVLAGTVATAAQLTRSPLSVRAFNAGQFGLATLAAGGVYTVAGGSFDVGSLRGGQYVGQLVVPLILATVAQCVVNAALVAVAVHLHEGVRARTVFLDMLRQGGSTYVGYGIFAILLAVLWVSADIGPLAAVLVLAPLYVARWAWAQHAEEQKAYDRTVRALVGAVETKDLYTRGHSERVSAASVLVAGRIRMDPGRTEMLRFAGILHDVGKIGVPTRVLRKTTRLTDAEFEAVALHPVRGLDMVRGIEFLREAHDGILHHHERLDGRGYPMGLRGHEIPEFARVIAVADAFDSMTSARSYRGARTVAEALVELRRCAGTQLEPRFVEALAAALVDEPWTPAEAPVETATTAPAGEGEAFDHDDPVAPMPPGTTPRVVLPRPAPGGERR